jgi:2-polyprenyl-6-methoxyphenol hydroxylase-like FAD-dependent oxidoreductase
VIGDDPDRDMLLALAQDRTENIMCKRLAEMGPKVRYSVALTGFGQNDRTVTARFDDGTTQEFDYLIGADGVHSTVRDGLGIAFEGHDLPEKWSIADVEAENWPNPRAFTICRLRDGHVCVVVPLEAARYRVISNTEDALGTLPLPITITRIRRAGAFHISVRQVPTYGKGLVYLAGDAAHCHSPVGGRGMNLGISDSAELAERMLAGTLDGYSPSRHAAGRQVIALSERGRKAVTTPTWYAHYLFAGALFMLNHLPMAQRKLRQTLLYG